MITHTDIKSIVYDKEVRDARQYQEIDISYKKIGSTYVIQITTSIPTPVLDEQVAYLAVSNLNFVRLCVKSHRIVIKYKDIWCTEDIKRTKLMTISAVKALAGHKKSIMGCCQRNKKKIIRITAKQ